MSDVVWKSFKLNSLFERSTKLALGINQKDLHISKEKTEEYPVALISASRNGSGSVGYLSLSTVASEKISFNKITFDDQWGYTYFQQDKFVITGGHNAILEIIDNKLKTLLDENIICYSFISLILNTITIKTGMYGYSYKVNNKFDREIILLPCLGVKETDDYIWEEDNHYYTLAVDYIKELMDEAKELREQKTIRLYEAERVKYEAEYQRTKPLIVWKSFKLGELFSWSSRKDLSLKNYELRDEYKDGYVEVITGSMNKDNKFVLQNTLPNGYPVYKNSLCLNTNGSIGYCFYYKNSVVSPTSSVHILIHKNDKLLLKMSEIVNDFFALLITRTFVNKLYNRANYLIDNNKFDREIILLPCLEVKKTDDYIWEEDNRYYTLAADYISYIYLTGRIMHYQKLIDKYVYQY